MPSHAEQLPAFHRHLRLFDATMVVMGGMIGAGIFVNPAFVAQTVPTSGLVILAWIVGGMIAFIGALIFAELGALLPQAGGQYVYLSRGIHPLLGFLNGWGLFWVITTGAIAFVSAMAAEYLTALLEIDKAATKPIAVGAIILISIPNYLGIRWGSLMQNLFMILKILALVCLIVPGLFAPISHASGEASGLVNPPLDLSMLSLLGVALVPVLFSYGGWQNCNNIAEEVKEPAKTIPGSVMIGTAAVILIYLFANVVYLRVLGVARLAASTTPAADVMYAIFGPLGQKLISLAVILSTLGLANLLVLASPRVYFAAVRDNGLIARAGRLHDRYRTPTLLIIAQAVWSILLLIVGSYRQLLSYIVFADWLFFGLTAVTLFIFRKKLPHHSRPFRTWGYPILPALFTLFAGFMVLNTFLTQFRASAIGLLILLSGVPVYYLSPRQPK